MDRKHHDVISGRSHELLKVDKIQYTYSAAVVNIQTSALLSVVVGDRSCLVSCGDHCFVRGDILIERVIFLALFRSLSDCHLFWVMIAFLLYSHHCNSSLAV